MLKPPSRETPARPENVEERHRSRVAALLHGGATLLAAIVTAAMASKKPPLHGD
jgi:hypothetical protein